MAAQSANSGPLSVRMGAEHAREGGLPTAFSSASSAPSVDAASLPGMSSASWNLQGALVQRQQAPTVGLQADHGVHLAGEPRSSSGSPMNAARTSAPRRGPCPRAGGARAPLVPALPAQLEARHSRVPALDPAVYGGGGDLELPARAPRDLRRREPRATSDPDGGHHRFELALVAVDARARRRQLLVGHRLGPGGGVLDPPALRAVVAAQLAAVAAARPRQQPRAASPSPRRPGRPAQAPRRERLRDTSSATVEGERPSSAAICLHDLRLSSPFSIATLSALSSLL